MKKVFITIGIASIVLGGIFYRVGQLKESQFSIFGTTVFSVQQGGTGAATLTGCLTGNGTGAITGTGSACGSGGSNSFAFPFTVYGNHLSTSTTIGFFNGLYSTASSTFSGPLLLSALSVGQLNVGTNGLLYSGATTTFSGGLTYSNGNVTCTGCGAASTPDLTYSTFSGTAFYTASSSATDNKSWYFNNGFVSNASSTLANSVFIPALSQGYAFIGSSGKLSSVASSSAVVGSATALAANGTNCASGFYPLGVDASGNSETCSSPFNFTVGSFVSTSTAIQFTAGLGSYSSTTINGLKLSDLSAGFAGIGGLGQVYSFSTSTIKGSQITNDSSWIASIFADSPLTGNGTSASHLTIPKSTASVDGYLAGADFSKFNSATTTFSTGLTYTLGTNAVTCDTSSATVFGCLTAAKFSQFNSATTTFTSPLIYTLSTNAVTCQTATAALSGCISAADFSKALSATTTFSTGLTYTSSTNAVTLTAPVTVALGGTNSLSFAPNSIITSNSAGTALIATTSQLTVGSLLATSTTATSTVIFRLAVGTVAPISLANGIFTITDSVNSYLQAHVQNKSSGTTASTDYVVANDLASDSSYFANFGINSSGNTDANFTLFAANDSYLYSKDSDLNIGTATTSRGNIKLFTGNTLTANERMRVTTDGLILMSTSTGSQIATLTIASSTKPQLSLSSGTGLAQWTFRNAGGNFYISTTTVVGTATTSIAAFAVNGTTGTTTLRGLDIQSFATSTSNIGYNITTGCYAILGTCLSGSGGGGSGTLTSLVSGQGIHMSPSPITTTGTVYSNTYANFVVSTTSTSGDFTDILTAIASLPSTGGKIHVTCGTFTLSATTTIKVANTVIEGEGVCTQFNFDKASISRAFVMNATGLTGIQLKDFYIHQTNATNGGIGIDASNTPILLVQRIKIDGTATSTSIKDTANQSFYSKYEDLDLRGNNTCIDIGGNPVNDNIISNVRCAPTSGNGGFGLYIDSNNANGSQNWTITNFDSEPTGAATGITGIYINRGTDLTLISPYLEGNATGLKITSNALRTGIYGGEIIANTTNVTDAGIDTVYNNVDINGLPKNQYTRSIFLDQGFDQPVLSIYNNTNFAHNSTDFVRFALLNSTDSSNVLSLVNPGTGATLISTSSTAGLGFIFDSKTKIGFGTTTLTTTPSRLTLASTTQPQLTLVGNVTDNQWHLRSIGSNLYFATSTGLTQATTSTSALSLIGNGKPGLGISTSTQNATLTIESQAGDYNYQMYIGSTTSPSLVIDNAKHIFIPNITVATGGTNQTVCFKSTTGELIDETTTACAISDAREKHDIKKLNVNAIDLLSQFKIVSYSMNDNVPYDYQNVQYGFTAQQVASVDPHFAEYGIDGLPRNLDDRAILAVVVKSIQELSVAKGLTPLKQDDTKLYILGILFLAYIAYNEFDKRKRK